MDAITEETTHVDDTPVVRNLVLCDRCVYYAQAGACEGCEDCVCGSDADACTRRESAFDARIGEPFVLDIRVGERDHGGAFTYGRLFGDETCDGCGEPFANDVTPAVLL